MTISIYHQCPNGKLKYDKRFYSYVAGVDTNDLGIAFLAIDMRMKGEEPDVHLEVYQKIPRPTTLGDLLIKYNNEINPQPKFYRVEPTGFKRLGC